MGIFSANTKPTIIYLFRVTVETLEKRVKYVQSQQ